MFSDEEERCVIVTQGDMHRQISPRGLLLSDTAGWHSPRDWKWPTPTTQQQKVQRHYISTLVCLHTNTQAQFVSACNYLCIVLTGGVLPTSAAQVEKIFLLLKPRVNGVRKRGDAISGEMCVPADVTERGGVLRRKVCVTRCCPLLCM